MAHKNKSNWSPMKSRKNNGTGSKHRMPTENYSLNEADDRIYDIFRNHDFGDFPHKQRQQLTRFYGLLMEHQQKQNFTRLLNLREVAIKHFIDSLMVLKVAELSFPLLDVGTGPGFPGIPLKIALPDQRIILAEGIQKRVEFLKIVREDMGLQKLDIIGRNVNPSFMYPVNGVITRAVEDASNTLGNVLQCLQTGGRVFLMKGPNCEPEIEPALKQWGEFYELEKNISYSLPNSQHERRLLIFKKIRRAPDVDLGKIIEAEEDAEEPSEKSKR